MRTIRLYGDLGANFGREFSLSVESPAEAIRALSYQIKGFKKYLIDAEKNGLQFRVFAHKSEIKNINQLSLNSPGEIRIVPVIMGANGEFRAIAGTALIIAAGFIEVGSGGAMTPFASFLFNTGWAMVIGGAAEVLTRGMIKNPTPPEKADNKPSFAFQGPVNTTGQGHPVPVGYGTMIVGGGVISASISAESLLSGYVYKTQETSKNIWSYGSSDGYQETLPPNWKRRVLVSQTNNDGTEMWLYSYFYDEQVLVLRTV